MKKKEIIRKEEVRVFEPKTGDWVMASMWGSDTWNKRKYIATIEDNRLWNYLCFREGEEDALHTEVTNWKFIKPIEEPKNDRIHKAYDYFENDTRCMLWWPNGRELFFETIEKYMPR